MEGALGLGRRRAETRILPPSRLRLWPSGPLLQIAALPRQALVASLRLSQAPLKEGASGQMAGGSGIFWGIQEPGGHGGRWLQSHQKGSLLLSWSALGCVLKHCCGCNDSGRRTFGSQMSLCEQRTQPLI